MKTQVGRHLGRNSVGVATWALAGTLMLGAVQPRSSEALELDWSGQFWSEFNFIHNYSMDGSDQGAVRDPNRAGQGGYYVPGGGNRDATFQSVFLRLRPKVIVNDNIYIKSEWWLGDPIYGIFGNSLPYSVDQRQFYSNQSRGSTISAQRYWGEFVTDMGTIQVGRMPLHWGLGVVWNSGDHLWDRYMSTGDAIRWVAKFGSFSLIPSMIVNSTGNTISGACTINSQTGACDSSVGSGGVTDYSLALKYENTDEELEAGINLIKRVSGAAQDPNGGILTPQSTVATTAGAMNYNIYDFYARKKLNRFTFAGEVPIVSGQLASATLQSFGVAGEVNWKVSDPLSFDLKVGYASGQPGLSSSTLDSFKAFYFNPNYHIGMILFNYQLANFAAPQTANVAGVNATQLRSPYDNPIVNTTYFSLAAPIKPWEKWTFKPGLLYAIAPQTAGSTSNFYNYWTKTTATSTPGKVQGTSLGWEFDLGITFQWDEAFQFSFDNGIYFPGSYYAYSNTQTDNAQSMVYASSVRIGVNF